MAKIHKILICTALIGALVVVFCAVPVSAQTITNGDVSLTNFSLKADTSCDYIVNGTNDGGSVSATIQSNGDAVRFNLSPSTTLKVGDVVDIVVTLYVSTPAMYDTTYNTTGEIYVGGARSGFELISCSADRAHGTRPSIYQNASVNIGGSDWGSYAYCKWYSPSFGNSYSVYTVIASYRVTGDLTSYARYFYVNGLNQFKSVPSETYNTDRVIQNQNENTDKILGEFFDPEYDTPDETTKDEYLDKESAALQDANDMMQGGNDVMNDAIGAFDKVGGLSEGLMAWSAIFAEFIGVPGMDGNSSNLYWLYWLVLIGLGLGLATFVIGSINAVVGRVRSINGKKRGKGG